MGWRDRTRLALAAGVLGTLLSLAAPSSGQVIMKDVPEEMKGIGQDNRLGDVVPMDVELISSEGKKIRVGDAFASGKPVVLALVYYSCPMMCPLMLQRLQERVNDLPYTLGDDFTLLVVSFNPAEKAELAQTNRDLFLGGYRFKRNPAIEAGTLFNVAEVGQAKRLADAVGFRYAYVEATAQYAHGSALTVLTKDGKIARYVDGLAAEKSELRLALLEASEGKIANSIGDFFLHFCYRWDPKTGKYTVQAMNVMKIGGLLTVLGLGTLIAGLRVGERARAARRAAATLVGTGSMSTGGQAAGVMGRMS